MSNSWRIDGHDWLVKERPDEPGTYDIDWPSGPNPGYGFTIGSSDGSTVEPEAIARDISTFLANINPTTGYLE